MTDSQLAILSQRGDRDAFTELAGRWDGRLQRFIARLLGNPEDARDVCQETLLRAYLNIDRLRKPQHFKAWIHQIAVNLCRDRGRSLKTAALREVKLEDDHVAEPVATSATPQEHAEDRDTAHLLHRMLARLPEEQRTAILLREFEDFTSSEIAEITGAPAATVRSRIYYGLKGLRSMLNECGVTGYGVEGGSL